MALLSNMFSLPFPASLVDIIYTPQCMDIYTHSHMHGFKQVRWSCKMAQLHGFLMFIILSFIIFLHHPPMQDDAYKLQVQKILMVR